MKEKIVLIGAGSAKSNNRKTGGHISMNTKRETRTKTRPSSNKKAGGFRIALIGAGSRSFGPKVIRDILLSSALCERGVELVLMDTVPNHLLENERYAFRLMEQLGRRITVTKTTNLEAALRGARFVITAFEVDRRLYWSQDFHVPRKYGFKQVFGENGGPGGIFHALRNMGPIMRIAKTMERLCPQAMLLNFSNPEHKLCEAVSRLSGIRAVGLCHGIHIGQSQVAEILGMAPHEILVRACGINHFTFFQTIKGVATGEDLYPKLRAAERRARWTTKWHDVALGRVMLRVFGLWPSPSTNHYGEYIRWAPEFMASELHYYYDALEGEPWVTKNIPDFVYTIETAPTNCAWHPKPEDNRPAIKQEHAAETVRPSSELAIPIMEAVLLNRSRDLEAVNITNRGTIPNLPTNMVVEVPARCDARGLQAVPMAPLPEPIAALMRTQASINQLLIEAFAEKSKMKLLQAILLDPTVDSYKQAVLMLNEMLKLQQDLLPAFK
ncbi:MAG: alpha-galactosidase [Verrucomicrobia bacterium]|nr:alpha-galactosidase [Verrucomicrobiota bacterium]MBU1734303.1 alpha-galactosidase [Verrucomicrobiota bacterium]MBU1857024.1 alpha-galactosidase [Verrucomicrobiota bacterium]